jgi:adenosine deaminase
MKHVASGGTVFAFALAILAACGGESPSATGASSSGGGTTDTTTATGGAGGAHAGGAGGAATGGAGTGGAATGGAGTGGANTGGANTGGAGTGGANTGGAPACGTPAECAIAWEDAAAKKLAALAAGPKDPLAAFLAAMPKGADLHNHLSGAVYAETYLGWAKADGDCIEPDTHKAVFAGSCGAGNEPTPAPGAFYDEIVRAWSMKDFVPGGAESGHDHFFATFGKYGAVSGAHRDESLADLATRAASENVQYVETMFNLGKNIGALSASLWSGTLTAADLPKLHAQILANASFAAELQKDVNVVDSARSGFRSELGCGGASPPAACDVGVRFIAQIARTGGKDTVFGQLVGAFEMANKTQGIVAANLSSPEDDTTSLANYDLHMAMLDYLHGYYTVTNKSPLHVTLHAGELTPKFLPQGYANAITFHVRKAVEVGHAERIGHGLDVMSETDPDGLLEELAQKDVLVEVCLSSNAQIHEVEGAAHPLAKYLAKKVPVALATDDQGVSRSSMAGEFLRGVTDQKLDYRTLKLMARQSLEHSFLPGHSLWGSIATVDPTAECAPTPTMGLGDAPNAACAAFLAKNERAAVQWRLEAAFTAFEKQQ